MRIGLVGCGSKKKNEPNPAAYLYDSKYFELKRKWAEQNCDDWYILSAKHGLIHPKEKIKPYDTNIKDIDTQKWLHKVIGQTLTIKFSVRDEIIFLAGKDYVNPLKPFFDSSRCRTRNLFKDTSGIGEQISLLKEEVSR